MRPPTKPFASLEQPDPAPDAAGLEPSSENLAQLQLSGDGRKKVIAFARPPRSRADLPASVRSILILALPTLAEQFFSGAIGITDTIVAGHTGANDMERAAAAAAVGAMTYLQWFGGLMTSALGVGATAIVARAIGARRPNLANRVAGTVCTASFLVGLAIAMVFFFFPLVPVRVFGLQGLAAEMAVKYLRIMSLTLCFQTAGQIGMACLRGAGDTFRPMIITLSITLVNCIACPMLAFGWLGAPRMGIRGNATGTLLAFAVSGTLTLALLLSGIAGIHLRRRHFKILPHLLTRVLKIGIPSWLEGMLLWGGQALIVIFAINPTDKAIGTDGATLAAHSATLRIESLAFLPGFGFGIACSALVGQYLGAKKPAEAIHAVRLCRNLALITMTVAAAPMVLFPHYMLHFMVNSAPVIATGVVPLIVAGLAQPGFAIAIIKSAALKGAGETVPPMMATMTGMVFRIILVTVLLMIFSHLGHPNWGLTAVWISIFLDLNYRAVYNTIVFRRGKWQNRRV